MRSSLSPEAYKDLTPNLKSHFLSFLTSFFFFLGGGLLFETVSHYEARASWEFSK